VSPTAGQSVESRRKADDLMMVCEMKEIAGDLHAALLCCNQAACMHVFMLFVMKINPFNARCSKLLPFEWFSTILV